MVLRRAGNKVNIGPIPALQHKLISSPISALDGPFLIKFERIIIRITEKVKSILFYSMDMVQAVAHADFAANKY